MEEKTSVISYKQNVEPILNYIEKNATKLSTGLLVGLLFLFTFNIFLTSASSMALGEKVDLIKEANKPVKIELSIINCDRCYDITGVIDSVKKQNIELVAESILDQNSDEAKELISKYNIKKLPSIIISGEISTNKTNFNGFELVEDALVLDKIDAPYFDLSSNELKGKVIIKEIVDSSCDECFSLTPVIESLMNSNVLISGGDIIEYDSVEGKRLIKEFDIKKIPALLISDDVNYYEGLKESLNKIGAEEKNKYYSLHSLVPPYRDLESNKIAGLVELIMINDETCVECYDVNYNKKILANLGLTIKSEVIYDVSSNEGKELISKYNIEKVPTILLSPEAEEYTSFVQAWDAVGSEESDGWFIMKLPERVGVVKNIITNKIIGN